MEVLSRLRTSCGTRLTGCETRVVSGSGRALSTISSGHPSLNTTVERFGHVGGRHLDDRIRDTLDSVRPALSSFRKVCAAYQTTSVSFPSFRISNGACPLSFILCRGDCRCGPSRGLHRTTFGTFSGILGRCGGAITTGCCTRISGRGGVTALHKCSSIFSCLLSSRRIPHRFFSHRVSIVVRGLNPIVRGCIGLVRGRHNLSGLAFSSLRVSLSPRFTPGIPLSGTPRCVSSTVGILKPGCRSVVVGYFSRH